MEGKKMKVLEFGIKGHGVCTAGAPWYAKHRRAITHCLSHIGQGHHRGHPCRCNGPSTPHFLCNLPCRDHSDRNIDQWPMVTQCNGGHYSPKQFNIS
ncbi:hypothetical protein GDO81_020831 [Engystomops pustulosus]|uniref:Uncharacterized protein n=1 Tax=Engystomops pustulosus TaxID=76066 RepID=A0AAV6YQF5_ENGPU|nr:hypothetical protein GDO81_020831 [Engystomops pustulosus]